LPVVVGLGDSVATLSVALPFVARVSLSALVLEVESIVDDAPLLGEHSGQDDATCEPDDVVEGVSLVPSVSAAPVLAAAGEAPPPFVPQAEPRSDAPSNILDAVAEAAIRGRLRW